MSAEYNIAIQEFMNMNFSTSEQHKDLTIVQQVSTTVADCSPYEPDPTLSNIVNVIVAQDDVNFHEYDSVHMIMTEKTRQKPLALHMV